jgi:cell shape-determining protein MreD
MGDVRPNLILAAVVAVTALFGLGAGALWAFVGGLTANLLTVDPLGTIPLGLLAVAALVALLARPLGRRGAALALVGGAVGSAVIDLAGVAVLFLEGDAGPASSALGLAAVIVPTAIVNGALAGVIYLGARAAIRRVGTEMPATWG